MHQLIYLRAKGISSITTPCTILSYWFMIWVLLDRSKKFAMMACEGFLDDLEALCDSTAFCSDPFPVKLHPAHAIATDRARSTGPVAFPRI
jgi:hypothetical protein